MSAEGHGDATAGRADGSPSSGKRGPIYYWRAYKRVGGRVRSVYIGRDWNREALLRFKMKAKQIEQGD